ncbi:MAG: glycosyltransferase family 39 protein [Anaerolineae bacterium]|nr:glycosyltransferase family 39 protein [Anaerolineae bacterium]
MTGTLSIDSAQAKASRQSIAGGGSRFRMLASDDFWITMFTLLAFSARLWDIGEKGLWYDEASTALMARAGVVEITQFHWRSAFEHPPFWVLLMHFWSMIWGQSEFALRLPAAFAGTLLVPVMWQNLKLCWPADRIVRSVAALFIAIAPVLILYSQEARMYAIITLLAAISIYLFLRLQESDGWGLLAAFTITNVVMLGLHYYSVLLIAAETLCVLLMGQAMRRGRARLIAGLALSILPLILWAMFSPGFQMTLRSVMAQPLRDAGSWQVWADRLWRDITFGSVVWQPSRSAVSYILAPLLLLGVYAALRSGPRSGSQPDCPLSRTGGILFALVLVTALLASAAFQNAIHTRYVLFIAPVFYVMVALGIGLLWRRARWLGMIVLIAPLVVMAFGLTHYYASYQKSGYRDMARAIVAQAAPADAILLESPRQHLLAKYYLLADRPIYPLPDVPVPEYWPLTAPPIIPEKIDEHLRMILRDHGDAWLLLAGQDEVDRGEFVTKYLTAIAYTLDCRDKLDVRWCRYTSPARHPAELSIPLGMTYNGELQLGNAQVAHLADPRAGQSHLLVALDWLAQVKPSVDYVVTLRLIAANVEPGVPRAQADGMPIGPLLPTTAWGLGDRKPGYMTLTLPPGLPPGDYRIVLGVYDPRSGAPYSPTGSAAATDSFVPLAGVRVGPEGVQLSSPGP